MKIQRVRVPVRHDDNDAGTVTGVLKVPRGFVPGETSAIVLAHGAGGGVDDPMLTFVQSYLVGRGFLTLGFNFPYREAGRRAPDREGLLEATVRSALEYVRHHPTLRPGRIFIGGKSMGGRMASHLAASDADLACGLVLLAYPLHAPGRPDRVRDRHLAAISMPTLFVSGTRDALAPLPSLRDVVSKMPRATVSEVAGGDHSFKVLKRSGRSDEDVWCEVSEVVAGWLEPLVLAPAAPPTPDHISSHPTGDSVRRRSVPRSL